MTGKKSAVVRSYIRGFHVYKDIWELVIDQVLPCIQEPENPKDRNAIVKDSWTCSQKYQCMDGNIPEV